MQFNIPVEFKNASGVYIIRNSIDGRVYVGSTRHFWKRYGTHLRDIKSGKHHCRHLQYFTNKHGIDALSFELHENCSCERETLMGCEQKWLDYFSGTTTIFNTSPTAYSLLGIKRSEETKMRMSAARKALGITPEHRAKLVAGSIGRKNGPLSEETKRRIRETKMRRAAERAAALGVELKPKAEYMRDGVKVRWKDLSAEEQRTLKSERMKAVWANPDYSAKASANLKVKWKDPTFRSNITMSLKARILPESARKKQAETFKARWAAKPPEERKQSPETIAKREATKRANGTSGCTRKWTQQEKDSLSEKLKGNNLGRKWSPESIAKRTATIKAKRIQAQPTLF